MATRQTKFDPIEEAKLARPSAAPRPQDPDPSSTDEAQDVEVEMEAEAVAEAPPLVKYRVARGKMVSFGGSMTFLSEGSVVSRESGYDVAKLREAGVELVEIG